MKSLKQKYKGGEILFAACLLAPLLIGLGIFYIYPIFRTVFYSFTKWGMFGGHTWVGLANYQKLLGDDQIWLAFRNTLVYALISVPLSIFVAIILASLLNGGIKGLGIYRTIYFLPAVTMTAAIAMIFRYTIFEYNSGIINTVIAFFGGQKVGWLSDPKVAMTSLIIVGIWASLGRMIVIFLAGLQGISGSCYEAAEIDGAGVFQKFVRITLPLLSPTIFFTVITQIIAALQVYDTIYMMFQTEGNLAMQSVQSLVYMYYRNAFVMNDKGYASAIAVLLLGVTLVFTALNFTFQKKWVHYD